MSSTWDRARERNNQTKRAKGSSEIVGQEFGQYTLAVKRDGKHPEPYTQFSSTHVQDFDRTVHPSLCFSDQSTHEHDSDHRCELLLSAQQPRADHKMRAKSFGKHYTIRRFAVLSRDLRARAPTKCALESKSSLRERQRVLQRDPSQSSVPEQGILHQNGTPCERCQWYTRIRSAQRRILRMRQECREREPCCVKAVFCCEAMS